MTAAENVDKSLAENASNKHQQEVEKIPEADIEKNMAVLDEVCSEELYSKKAKAAYENADCAIAFELLNVDKQDQVFKIDKIKDTRTGFEVNIKVKKDNKKLEEAIKHIETYSGWTLQMKLKKIFR
jgi:hypothetical protein